MLWKILILVLAASVASHFVPTPQVLTDHFKSGQNYFAARDFKKAIQEYEIILSTQSKFLNEDSVKVTLLNREFTVGVKTAAYYQRANAHKSLKNYDEALRDFRVVVNERKDSPKLSALAQYQIYDMFYSLQRYREAITEAKLLLEKYPSGDKSDKAYYDMGWSYRELGNVDSSNMAFRFLVDHYDSSEYRARGLYQIAQNQYDREEWEKAIPTFRELLEKYRPERFSKKEFENIELRATKERQLFEATGGRESDQTALELVAKAQVKIGECYDKLPNYDKAMEAYRQVIINYALIPTLLEVTYVKMANLTIREKGLEEGISLYRKAIDEHFNDKVLQAKLQYKIAQSYQDQKQYRRAAEEFRFYARAYNDVADAISFPVERADYAVVVNYYSGRVYENAVSESDSFLTKYASSDFVPDVMMLKGLALQAQRQPAVARPVFEGIVKNHPQSNQYVAAKVQVGQTYFEEKKYDEALKTYMNVIQEDSSKADLSELYYSVGLSYYSLQKYDEALSYLKRVAYSSTAFYPQAFGRITKSYIAQKKYDVCEQFIKEMLERSRKDSSGYSAQAHFALADLYAIQEKFDTAAVEFSTVVDDPKTTENLKVQARYARGALYHRTGKYAEAVEDLEYCLSNQTFLTTMESLVPNANEKLSLCYVELKRQKEAIDLLQKLAASSTTDDQKARYVAALADVYYSSKEYDKGIENANQVLANPQADAQSKAKAYITTANCHGGKGALDKAESVLAEAATKFPESFEIQDSFYKLALLHYGQQNYAVSSEILDKFLTKYPKSPTVEQATFLRGYSLFQVGKWDDAVKIFRKYVQSYPNSKFAVEAQFEVAEALFNANKFEDAMKEYQAVYKKYPKSEFAARAAYNEGWCYYQVKQLPKMVELFKEFVSKYPENALAGDAQFAIGDYYYNDKDYQNAEQAYRVMVEKFPNHARIQEARDLLHELGQITSYLEYEQVMTSFFDNRNYEKSIEELTKVTEKYPDADIVIGCKLNIASAYEQLANYQKAMEIFRDVLSKYENDPMQTNAVAFARQHITYIESKNQQ
jgi:tetratricopeptide (TPR) repeat protein